MNFAGDAIPPAGPPFWHAGERAWIVTRYADAMRVLCSEDASALDSGAEIERLARRTGQAFPRLGRALDGMLIFHNPPRHARSRSGVRAILGPGLTRWTQAEMDRQAATVVNAAGGGGPCEATGALADALVNAVIADLLGFDLDTLERLRAELRTITEAWRRPLPLRDYPRLEAAADRALGRLSPHGPGDGGEATVLFLVLAGVENSAAFLGNMLHFLASRPDLQAMLARQPERLDGFIDEALRLRGPLKRLAPRRLASRLDLGDADLPAGAIVTVRPDSANRDPAAYPDPDRCDLDRTGPPALTFSAGAHACMGASLARMEARALLSCLLARFTIGPGPTPPERRDSPDFRQFGRLELMLTPRRD